MKKLIVMLCMVLMSVGGMVIGVCPRADLTGDCEVNLADFAIMASEWLDIGEPLPILMTWVSINDIGVSGHERFNGLMSKYETTNAQYCQYLNAAGVTVFDDIIYAWDDTNHSQPYYDLAGPGYTFNGATNGGAARISPTGGGSFTVDSGFENHPVTYVSWYGATAFASYYGYRLPTEWEWQAVADHTVADPYTYGCGPTINNGIANYYDSMHPDGTTVVGSFGAYGYRMCDMAGNVWEWTASFYGNEYRVIRGGSWSRFASICRVDYRPLHGPSYDSYDIGFRVCLDLN